jgi:hypothetical protein
VNFAWPRPASNPKPSQTGGLLNFHIGFLNDIPILWTVFVVIVVIGALYYLLAARRKPFSPVIPPEEEVAAEAVAS